MPDAPATADYFEDQLPPVVPLDVSLHLLHPCCGCVAVTLSLSLFCSLFIGWLRLIAMDGRSIDLAAHQKGTFFHRKLILIISRLLFFLPLPRPPTKSLIFGLVLFAGWLAGSLVGSSG